MFIYKLTNIINNKIYIGLTTETIKERCRKRNVEARLNLAKTSYILNAIRKYGENNFKVEQIDTANSLEELKNKEVHYIKYYNSKDRNIGYNLTEGGEGNKGLKMSDKTKNKIRIKHLGLKDSEETKLKKSKSAKLRDHTIGINNFKLHNLETSKTILKYDLNNNFITEYSSISEAQKKDKIDRSGLTKYLQSNKAQNNKGYKGYIYKLK